MSIARSDFQKMDEVFFPIVKRSLTVDESSPAVVAQASFNDNLEMMVARFPMSDVATAKEMRENLRMIINAMMSRTRERMMQLIVDRLQDLANYCTESAKSGKFSTPEEAMEGVVGELKLVAFCVECRREI